jgi:serine-type D-Ala-D-Ala carboxypeptidase/endopeptidase
MRYNRRPMRLPKRACVAFITITILLARAAAAHDLEREHVDALVRPVIEARVCPALVVGWISGGNVQIAGYGQLSANQAATPDGDTLFEIGSISKVFTALLLAEMCNRGEVTLQTQLHELLPPQCELADRVRAITLTRLASHTSGLPRLPGNLAAADWEDPYADYTVAQMYAFLSRYDPPDPPSPRAYAYSNLGMGLLGHLLALRSGADYPELLAERVLRPLGMTSTACRVDAAMQARLAPGHDGAGWPTRSWDIPTLAGAGALRSSANDLAKFILAHFADAHTPLEPALRAIRARQASASREMDVALGWHIRRSDGMLMHDGGTGGYTSFIALHPEKQIGVIVLANASTGYVGQIGLRVTALLLGETPEPLLVENPLSQRAAITMQRVMIRMMAEATKNAVKK